MPRLDSNAADGCHPVGRANLISAISPRKEVPMLR